MEGNNMIKHTIAIAVVAALLLALATAALAADDPFVGVWKSNAAKSKIPDPDSSPKSVTIQVEPQGKSIVKTVFDVIGVDGKAIHFEFTAKRDGKDYPIIGNPDLDAIVYKQIDQNIIDYIVKKDGREVKSGREFVSKDGKTMTQNHKEKKPNGESVTRILVYDKQ
jgi:hypothetical protein